jgi:hypothetical protein
MTAKTTFFVAQRGVGPLRRPSTRCCGDSPLPGTPVRDNIRLKWAAIWGMPHYTRSLKALLTRARSRIGSGQIQYGERFFRYFGTALRLEQAHRYATEIMSIGTRDLAYRFTINETCYYLIIR